MIRPATLLLLPVLALLPGCPRGGKGGTPDAPPGTGAPAAGTPAGAGALFVADPQPLAAMQCGRPECPTILEVNGGGAALFDGDGDGDMDLLLVSPGAYPSRGAAIGGTNRLYRNDGGRLTDATAGSGVDVAAYCNGVAVGDVDADGRRDLYLTCHGSNVLLRNEGGLRFSRVPDAAGAAAGGWSTSAVFVDLDRDGDLDLYVTRYLDFDPDDPPMHGSRGRSCLWLDMPVMCGPQGLPPQADLFLLNDGGRFRDATAERGFAATPSFGLGVIDGDWNGDGWPDLYVSNDSMPNFLFTGTGDGSVREDGVLAGAALSSRGREQAGMGIAAADADGDGDEELLVTNFSLEPNAFYVNRGDGRFTDRADPMGLGAPSRAMLGWGALFADVDLDGDMDLLTANGHVYPQADAPGTGTSYAQADQLALNDGSGRFTQARWPGEAPAVSRALAAGDLDDDGVTDVVVTRLHGPPAVWRGAAKGAVLTVTVRGRPGNPDACGAVVVLRDAQGARHARVRTSGGFQATCDPRLRFAWRGAATLAVTFPDGRTHEQSVDAPGALSVEVSAP
jgi:enediyne biosynthesis protein E4